MNEQKDLSFAEGLKDAVPIALGYLSVSFGFGIMAVQAGIPLWAAVLISLSNVTSAGQVAGVTIISAAGGYFEMALTQFIINLRYSLMSLSLSQKLDESVTFWKKLIIAFGNTDEIFAVAMNHQKSLTLPYMVGLQSLPIVGWTAGTFLGAVASGLMPERVSIAMNVMLYGMFIAIVIPEAKKKRPVLIVALIAVALSCLFYYIPGLNEISAGISIIICTVVAAAVGAVLFPIK